MKAQFIALFAGLTRILIYCNNNFINDSLPLTLKSAPLALNIPTFITLYGYGYKNLYELGPAVDENDGLIEFESNLELPLAQNQARNQSDPRCIWLAIATSASNMRFMQTASVLESSPRQKWLNADRIGVIASTLCAIHCAVTPFLLLLLPAFGKLWAHPATHWGMALLVVPIAVMMMTSGYRKHRRKWIVAMGTIGVALVIVGAIVPYVGNAEASTSQGHLAGETGEAGETLHEESCSEEGVDACCPSLTTDAEGNTKLNIPAASIITSLGGLALIVTHLGNLCTCASCGQRKGDDC